MKLYNTLTKEVQEIPSSSSETVHMYTCGPTVYNYAHIGNFRSYLFADSIYQALKAEGKKIDWVMNLTDVDDKTIRDTIKQIGQTATTNDLRSYTDKYINIFLDELKQVSINPENIRIIRVADVIPDIQTFILDLIEKGYAYQTDDGTFFSIEKYQTDFGDYGELVGKRFLEGKKVGARVKVDEYEKDNLSDFALWKAHTPEDANIFWDHPTLGKGRPGWHIECSVINNIAFAGQPTDLHTGGVDLIFPHHTNEIAQSQPFYKPFAKHWAHCEHLQVDGRKMAKSEKNFFTLQDLRDKNENYPAAFRYLCEQTDFRKTLNFSWNSLEAVLKANNNLSEDTIRIGPLKQNIVQKYQDEFYASLHNDLNTSKAISSIYGLLKEGQQTASQDPSGIDANLVITNFASTLGIKIMPAARPANVPTHINKLISERNEARVRKDFAKSDELRAQIEAAGYEVLDTKDGTSVRVK